MKSARLIAFTTLAALAITLSARADDSATELAKQSQNPIANVINVPFQNNFNFNTGKKDATVWILDVQPVIPIKLTEDWNLVTRTVIPIMNQPSLFPGSDSAFGLGDINPTLFLSPAKPGKLIWGVGPTFTFPTATDSEFGGGKYSMGPAVIALTIQGHWVLGVLMNNQWSYAGWGDKNVNQMLLQPIVNYNLGHGWYLVSVPIMTANWEAKSGQQWTVPVGGGVGRLVKLGRMAVDTQVQAFSNVVTPDVGPDWQLRLQMKLLFPK